MRLGVAVVGVALVVVTLCGCVLAGQTPAVASGLMIQAIGENDASYAVKATGQDSDAAAALMAQGQAILGHPAVIDDYSEATEVPGRPGWYAIDVRQPDGTTQVRMHIVREGGAWYVREVERGTQ